MEIAGVRSGSSSVLVYSPAMARGTLTHVTRGGGKIRKRSDRRTVQCPLRAFQVTRSSSGAASVILPSSCCAILRYSAMTVTDVMKDRIGAYPQIVDLRRLPQFRNRMLQNRRRDWSAGYFPAHPQPPSSTVFPVWLPLKRAIHAAVTCRAIAPATCNLAPSTHCPGTSA